MGGDRYSKRFPIIVQCVSTELIDVTLVSVDREDAVSILGAREVFTRTFFLGDCVTGFE